MVVDNDQIGALVGSKGILPLLSGYGQLLIFFQTGGNDSGNRDIAMLHGRLSFSSCSGIGQFHINIGKRDGR